jgi:multidrug efflux pump subunit AcrA (membrane-fusion protein)
VYGATDERNSDMQKNWRKLFYAMGLSSTIAVSSLLCSAVAAADSDDPTILTAHTEPSELRQLSFRDAGIVKQVAVKEGDAIKSGQLLVAQDDDIEAAELERLQNEANSSARQIYYELGRDVKLHTYERKSKAPEGTFNISEIEEAKADYEQAVQQIEVNKLDQDGNKNKARQGQFKVNKMKLYGPFDGFVETIGIKEGEFATPDRDKPAIVVVKNDPCDVTIMKLLSSQVAKLKNGETMQVRYIGETEWRNATIVYISPVADGGSDNQIVRLELPNAENRATGLPIQVKLPAKLLENNGASGGVARTALRSNN